MGQSEGDYMSADEELTKEPIKEVTTEVVEGSEHEVLTSDEQDAEQFAYEIMKRAASLKVVKIDRGEFLRTTLKKYCPEVDASMAVETSPIEAGVAPRDLDEIALNVIDFETKKCAGLSFLAGIPGGVALAGTVPADLAQYFAHVMRVEQKLAYLYGWQTFLNPEDEVDDETLMKLIVLMGIMLEVGGVANSVTKFATDVAQKSIAKTIERQALTKTFFYTPMKKVLRVLGVNLTKQTFAKGVSKVVPVVGGVVSGGLTYASFKPGAERLRRYLRELPTSGIDLDANPDIIVIREQARAEERALAMEQAKVVAAEAADAAGKAAAEAADAAGKMAAGAAEAASKAAAGAADVADKVARSAFGAAGAFLTGLANKDKK
jgi:hypothetical protein